MTMKRVAFVPVKLNNQRMPGKNTRRFDDGVALITHFLRTLAKVKGFDDIAVFCSDPSIRDFLVPGTRFLQRPQYLDTQQATPQDIIAEFMKAMDADIYAVCHCTAPFVTAQHIEACLKAVENSDYDSAFTAERIQRLLWTADNTPLNFAPDNVPRTQDLAPYFSEVSAAYVFRKEVFLKYRRRIGIHPYIVEVSGIESIDIDYPEDFEMANAVYMNIVKNMRGGGDKSVKRAEFSTSPFYFVEAEVA